MADLSLSKVDSVNVVPDSRGYLFVEVEGADVNEILSDITIEEAVSYFGNDLVDHIKEEYNLTEVE